MTSLVLTTLYPLKHVGSMAVFSRTGLCRCLTAVTSYSSYTLQRAASTLPSKIPTPSEEDPALSFEDRHQFLTARLDDSGYVKATDVNKLFLNCTSLEELERAKDILARFRKSPSHHRDSQAMVVIKTCKRLGVPEQALAMAIDKVKYGLFPARNASHELLVALVAERDIEGVEKTIELFRGLEIPFTGMQHFLLAKLYLRKLLDERSVGKKEEEVREEKKGSEGGKEQLSEEQGTSGGEKGELSLEDLGPTLERCKEALALSAEYGERAYYFVNGKLLSEEMYDLSSQMLDQLESEGSVPPKAILYMRMDILVARGDRSGTMELVEKVKSKGWRMISGRVQRLHKLFESCEDEDLKRRFSDLNLTA